MKRSVPRPARAAVLLAVAAGLVHCKSEKAPPPAGSAPETPPASAASAAPAVTAPSSATAARPKRAPFASKAVAAHGKTIAALTAAFNRHDAKGIAELYDPDCVVLSPSPGGWSAESGREPIVVGHEALFTAQPDLKIGVARVFTIGDFVVEEWVANGTDRASGKPVGMQAATVYRIGANGLIKRDSTYFDLLTPAVQTGKKPGEARPIPPLPEKSEVVTAGGTAAEADQARIFEALHAAMSAGRPDDVARLLTDDVTERSLLSVTDAVGKEAVAKELAGLAASLPKIEITDAWGAERFAIAEVVLSAPPKDPREVRLHALHVVELAGGKIARSTLYASRRELEAE